MNKYLSIYKTSFRQETKAMGNFFMRMIVFAIIYTIIAHSTKKEYKEKKRNRGPKPTEVIIHE